MKWNEMRRLLRVLDVLAPVREDVRVPIFRWRDRKPTDEEIVDIAREIVLALAPEVDQLAAALVRLDTQADKVLLASLHPKGGVESELHTLDEVRGTIWATYDAASDALKAAEREASL